MESIIIWSVSFLVVFILVPADELERTIARRVNKISKNSGILGINSNISQTAGSEFLNIHGIAKQDDEKKETLPAKLYKKALKAISDYKEALREELHKAGIRNTDSLQATFRTTILSGALLAIVIFLQVDDIYPEIFDFPCGWLIVAAFSVYGGFFVASTTVKKFITSAAQERREQIENGIPDLLDLMVICSEAGFDVQKILQRTANEISVSNKTLADELQRTNAEFKLSSNFYQILKNLEQRTESVKIQSICNIIIQSIEMGTSLTESLKTLSHEIRNERAMKAEEQAGKIPNKITMPLLIFIMPCLFIVILAPMLLKASGTFGGT